MSGDAQIQEALDRADALLAGELPVRVHSVRAAAWVARSALETTLVELVRAKGCDPGDATARTMLGCVESLYAEENPQIAASAQYAWDRLSEASHHHAYELAPTHVEVEALVAVVRGLSMAHEGS